MTVKQLVKKCLEKLNVEDFSDDPKTDREKNLANGLLNAFEAVYGEIIAEYVPFVTEEKVVFENGRTSAEGLSKQIVYPIKVVCGRRQTDFCTDAEYIYAEAEGEATLTYAYLPSTEFTFESKADIMGASADMLSDGMLAQYCLAAGMYELAKSFDASYREKLWKLRYKNKGMRMKARRWDK